MRLTELYQIAGILIGSLPEKDQEFFGNMFDLDGFIEEEIQGEKDSDQKEN